MDAFFQKKTLEDTTADTVACPLCTAIFTNVQAAQEHYATTHDDSAPLDKTRSPDATAGPILCPICSQTFPSTSSASLHINAHFDSTPAARSQKKPEPSRVVRKSASARAMQRGKATKKAKTMMKNYFKPKPTSR
jgi:uncharacterized C2H2 Zn-finger protein